MIEEKVCRLTTALDELNINFYKSAIEIESNFPMNSDYYRSWQLLAKSPQKLLIDNC